MNILLLICEIILIISIVNHFRNKKAEKNQEIKKSVEVDDMQSHINTYKLQKQGTSTVSRKSISTSAATDRIVAKMSQSINAVPPKATQPQKEIKTTPATKDSVSISAKYDDYEKTQIQSTAFIVETKPSSEHSIPYTSNNNQKIEIPDISNKNLSLKELLKINKCQSRDFELLNRKLTFSPEKMSFLNLMEYCDRLKIHYIREFENEWRKLYVANEKENFQRNVDIITRIFAEIYERFNFFWSSIGYEKSVEEILDSYQVDELWQRQSGYNCQHINSEFIEVTNMYLSTVVGKIHMYNDELNKALDQAKREKMINRPLKQHSGSWVGGGFGFKGALKGALTAAALNTIESTVANIKNTMNSESVSEGTRWTIQQMKESLDKLQKNEKVFIRDINTIIDVLFMATSLISNIGFSYQKYLTKTKSASKGLVCDVDAFLDAIQAYPFTEEHYNLIIENFPDEKNNVEKIKAVFVKIQKHDSCVDFNTYRKRHHEIATLKTYAYTYEENGHHQEAIQYYKKILDIDANNEDAKDGLARLGVSGFSRKKTITNVDLYNTFIRDYTQVANEEFVREGLENAKKLNSFCYRDGYGYIRLHGGSRLNDKMIELITGMSAKNFVQVEDNVYVPTLNERRKVPTSFKEYVFVNGRTVAYKRNCYIPLNSFDDIAYTEASRVITSNTIEEFMNQCSHLKK